MELDNDIRGYFTEVTVESSSRFMAILKVGATNVLLDPLYSLV